MAELDELIPYDKCFAGGDVLHRLQAQEDFFAIFRIIFYNFEERSDDHRRIVVTMFIFIHPTPGPLPASGEGSR